MRPCYLTSASRSYSGRAVVSAHVKHAGLAPSLMQRVGGGFRELPPSLYSQLEQANMAVDELRRQLAAQQASTSERDGSLEKRRAEVEPCLQPPLGGYCHPLG